MSPRALPHLGGGLQHLRLGALSCSHNLQEKGSLKGQPCRWQAGLEELSVLSSVRLQEDLEAKEVQTGPVPSQRALQTNSVAQALPAEK